MRRRKRRCKTVLAACVVGAVPLTNAFGDVTWVQSVTFGSWNTAANWNTGTIPLSTDNVFLTGGGNVHTIIFNTNYTSNRQLKIDGTGTGTLWIGAAPYVLKEDGSQTFAVGSMMIGVDGKGIFSKSLGTTTVSTNIYLGVNDSGLGVLGQGGQFNLSGGTLSSGAEMRIGNFGFGTFNQSGGTHTVNNNLLLAVSGNSIGQYDLSGGTLSVTGIEFVGYNSGGTGIFNQTAGIHAIGTDLVIGNGGSVKGRYTLSGSSNLTVSGDANVGLGSPGSGIDAGGIFTQNGGVHQIGVGTTSRNLYVARNAGSTGIYYLNSGTLSVTGGITVGDAGSGQISQGGGVATSAIVLTVGNSGQGIYAQSGGTANTATLALGNGSTGSGTYTLSNGSLSVDYAMVGLAGAGSFIQSGGTVNFDAVGVPQLLLAATPGSTGYYGMSGGTLTISMPATNDVGLYVGNFGAATFNHTAGRVSLDPYLYIAYNPGSIGTYLLSSTASLSVLGYERVGYGGAGRFLQSGGAHTVNLGQGIGYNAGSSGTYALSGGTLNVNGSTTVGVGGAGTFIQSGGVHTITGSLTISDQPGSGGYFLLSGGSLTVGREFVSRGSNGTFVQTGGVHTVNTFLDMGGTAGAVGRYILSGGTLSVAVGTETIGGAGQAYFVQTGGTHIATRLAMGPKSAFYSLLGGTLNTSTLAINNTDGLDVSVFFQHSNSVHNASTITLTSSTGLGAYYTLGSGTLNANRITLNSRTSFNLDGGLLSANLITVNSNGTFNSNGGAISGNPTITINAGGTWNGPMPAPPAFGASSDLFAAADTPAGAFVQNGGAVTGDQIVNAGAYVYNGGSFHGQLVNHGTASINTDFSPSGGIVNAGMIVAASGVTITTSSLELVGDAKLILSDSNMVIDHSDEAGTLLVEDVRQDLLTGRISSGMSNTTRRLGYVDNGEALTIQSTYSGDSNLDGMVDLEDLLAMARHFNTGNGDVWTDGDFNYDGAVDSADLSLLAANWQAGMTGTSSEPLSGTLAILNLPATSVPEPTVLALAAGGALYRRRRQRRRRYAAAAMALACSPAAVAVAAAPTFNSGTVTIIHDLDVNDPSTVATRYKSIIVSPPAVQPTSYQLNSALSNTGTTGSPTSSATASVVRVQNPTTTTLTLAPGTGVTQTDPSHVIGASMLRFNINDLTWTPNTTFGPVAMGYFSVTVGGVVAGSAQFSGQLTFRDQYNNPLRSTIVFSPTVFTSTGQLPRSFTSSAPLSPTALSSSTKVRLTGFLEFRANNDVGPTSLSPLMLDAGAAPPTAIWYGASGSSWNSAANWTPPAGSVIDDPFGTIPTVPNARGERALISSPSPNLSITIDSPITLGSLDLDATSFSLNGASAVTFSSPGLGVDPAINFRGGSSSTAAINAPVQTTSGLTVNTPTGELQMGAFTGGGGALTKSGSGRLVLSSATASGLVVNSGEVAVLGNTTFTNVTVSSGASLTVGNGTTNGSLITSNPITNLGQVIYTPPSGGTGTVSNQITGTGGFVKTGSGSVVLTGTHTYSGSTTVNQGVLVLDTVVLPSSPTITINNGVVLPIGGTASLANKVINLGPGGYLNLTAVGSSALSNTTLTGMGGTVQGSVILPASANISPGSETSLAGTVNFSNSLNINGGRLNYDLNAATTTGGGVNDLVNVGGNTTLNSGFVAINAFTGMPTTGNVYRLLNSGTITGLASNLALINNTRHSLSLSTSGPQLNLTVTSAVASQSLTWAGTAGTTWDINNTVNWQSGTQKFYGGDSVTFNDSASTSTVTLSGKLTPESVTVNNSSLNYTFGGSGRISGTTGLTKQGTASLTLLNSNDYTGPTTISGGVVVVPVLRDGGAPSPLGASSNAASNLVLDGGSLRYIGGAGASDRLFNLGTSNGTLDSSGSGSFTFSNSGTMGFDGTGARTLNLTGNNAERTTLVANISDNGGMTSLAKYGSGTWVLAGSNTYTGTTTVNAGVLLVKGTHTGGGTYTINSGAALGGTDNIDAFVNLNGGTLVPGASLGTLSLANLTLNSANLAFELDAFGGDRIIVNDPNGFAISGLSTFYLTNAGAAGPGTYPLIDYNGTPLGSIASLSLAASTFNGYTAVLVDNGADTSVDLNLTVVSGSWSGPSGNWSTPGNWIGVTPNDINQMATFPSSIASSTTVTVNTAVTVGRIDIDTASHLVLAGGSTLTIDADGTDAVINVNAGTHTISAPVALSKHLTVNVAASSGLDFTGSVTSGVAYLSKSGAGSVQLLNVRLPGLIVNGGSVVVSAKGTPNDSAGTSVVKALQIDSGAVLDLTNNSMIIDYDDPDQASDLIASVLSSRQDNRLISSSATTTRGLGYGDNAVLGRSSFAGQSVDSTSVLIKYTYFGDANLDGLVNISDLLAMANHWNTTGDVWTSGDFNGDGSVNQADLALLAQNWQAGVGAPLGPGLSLTAMLGLARADVPEPNTLIWVAAGLSTLSGRRRRQNRQRRN